MNKIIIHKIDCASVGSGQCLEWSICHLIACIVESFSDVIAFRISNSGIKYEHINAQQYSNFECNYNIFLIWFNWVNWWWRQTLLLWRLMRFTMCISLSGLHYSLIHQIDWTLFECTLRLKAEKYSFFSLPIF